MNPLENPLVIIVPVAVVLYGMLFVYMYKLSKKKQYQRKAASRRLDALPSENRRCGCGGLMTSGNLTTEQPGGRHLLFMSKTDAPRAVAALRCMNCGRTELYS